MPAPHPGPEPTPAPHAAALDELVALGMDLARQLHARASEGELPLEAATVAFERVARAVRRTVTLARHLAEPAAPRRARTAARARILREVEDTIGREPQGPETDRLTAELRERLDAPELEDEIGARPTEDIIADILRDLGLGHIPGFRNHWRRRTPADLADLHRRAAAQPARPAPGPPPRSANAGNRAGATTPHPPDPAAAPRPPNTTPAPRNP